MDYVAQKIAHMQRMGIPAGIGRNGGACPKWLTEDREADEKRRARRIAARSVLRRIDVIDDTVVSLSNAA